VLGGLLGGGSLCACSDDSWVIGSPDSFLSAGRISVRSSLDGSDTYNIAGLIPGARLGAGPCATLGDGSTVVFGSPLSIIGGINAGAIYIINTQTLSHTIINGRVLVLSV